MKKTFIFFLILICACEAFGQGVIVQGDSTKNVEWLGFYKLHYLKLPTNAGVPTNPSNKYKFGLRGLITVDTTNNQLYMYGNTGWLPVVGSAADSVVFATKNFVYSTVAAIPKSIASIDSPSAKISMVATSIGQTVFTPGFYLPLDSSKVLVFRNGIARSGYAISNTSITFPSPGLGIGDSVIIYRLGNGISATFNQYKGKNLYNPATNTSTGSGGSLEVRTAFIPVTPGLSYTLSGRLANAGANDIDGFNSSFASTGVAANFLNGTFTPAAGTVYIKFFVFYNGSGGGNIQVEQSVSATSYEPYFLNYSIASVNGNTIVPVSPAQYAAINAIAPRITEEPGGLNLYDSSKRLAGYIDGGGNFTPDANSRSTPFIKVQPNSVYTLVRGGVSGVNTIAQYDSTFTKVGNGYVKNLDGTDFSGGQGGTFKTSAGVSYVITTTNYNGASGEPVSLYKGYTYSPYEKYVSTKIIDSVGAVKVTSVSPQVKSYVQKNFNYWYSKKIVWIGTSIPAGSRYPEIAATNLGATLDNVALGSSMIRRTKLNGSAMQVAEQQKSLSSTVAEYVAAGYSSFSGNSYENKVLGKNADLYVFDMGFNDRTVDPANFDTWPSTDSLYARNSFIGATNYVIRELLKEKPRARICFITHHSDQFPPLNSAIEQLAAFWGAPVLKEYQKTGWTVNFTNPTTGKTNLSEWVPDTIHPYTDTTHQAEYLLGDINTQFLLNEVH